MGAPDRTLPCPAARGRGTAEERGCRSEPAEGLPALVRGEYELMGLEGAFRAGCAGRDEGLATGRGEPLPPARRKVGFEALEAEEFDFRL